MKTALIMEGGAMRGLFTCGIIDVFLEKGIEFDGAAGISAGAAFGCNIKSRQIERALRYNMNYSQDQRHTGLLSLLKNGDFYDVDFWYHRIPDELDVFDRKAFRENPMEFYVAATNVETGELEYHLCSDGEEEDIQWIRASASMPGVSRAVEINGKKYLDGGIVAPAPYRGMEERGYHHNLVILTQPRGFRKERNPMMAALKPLLKDYPKVIEAMEMRHLRYNETTEYIFQKEKEGEAFVICPEEPLNIPKFNVSKEDIDRAYKAGRMAAILQMDRILEFLHNCTK